MKHIDANTQALIALAALYFSIVLAMIALFFCWKVSKSYKKEEVDRDELDDKLDYRYNELMN